MKTVFITGASRGIGLELARCYLQAQYSVIATYRGAPSAELETLNQSTSMSLFELDVTNSDAIQQVALQLEANHRQIDIIINNAGAFGPQEQSYSAITTQGWLDTFSVNTIAPLMVTRTLLPLMLNSSNPRIITISSQMGAFCVEEEGLYAYRTSKAAVNKVMQILSLELKAQDICVCNIHPGWVKTSMGGEHADISPQESASGIVNVIDNLTMENTGKFYTWEDKEHGW